MRGRRALVVLPLLFVSQDAFAEDTKQKCAAAAEAAQVARLEGKLSRALESAMACDARECPRVVKNDCHEWRKALEPIVPSIIVRLSAENAEAMPNARVRLDGATIAALGDETRADPGEHELLAEATGFESKTIRFTLKEGELHRAIELTLRKEAATPLPSPAPPPPVRFTKTPAAPLALRVGLFGLAGVGVATFLVSGVPAYFDVQRFHDSCAPFCSSQELANARTRMIIGDIGLGIGAVALAAGAWLTFLGPVKEVPIAVMPSPHGASVAVMGKLP